MALKILCQAHYDKVRRFAEEVGAVKELDDALDYLSCGDHRVVELYWDFAPYSFAFNTFNTNGDFQYNGGLIYRGPGCPSNGSAPSFTVSLGPARATHTWEVHT